MCIISASNYCFRRQIKKPLRLTHKHTLLNMFTDTMTMARSGLRSSVVCEFVHKVIHVSYWFHSAKIHLKIKLVPIKRKKTSILSGLF